MHFNENSDRPRTTNQAGEETFKITFPKFKKKQGGYSIQRRKVEATYGKLTSFLFQGKTDFRGKQSSTKQKKTNSSHFIQALVALARRFDKAT
jgi:hypothetical protein